MSNKPYYIDSFLDLSSILPTTPDTEFEHLLYFNKDNVITTDTEKYIRFNPNTTITDVNIYSNPPINQPESNTNVQLESVSISLYDSIEMTSLNLGIITNIYDVPVFNIMSVGAIDYINPYIYGLTNIVPVKLFRLNQNTLAVDKVLSIPGNIGTGFVVVISPNNQYLYLIVDVLYKIDVSSFSLLESNTTVNSIRSITIDSNNTFGYVSSSTTNNLSKLDLFSFTYISNVNLGSYARRIIIDPTCTYGYICLNNGNLVKILLSTLTVISTIVAGTIINTGVISPYNDYIYIGTNVNIHKISVSTFSIISTLSIASSSTCSIIDPFGIYTYFGSSNNILKIDCNTLTIVGTISIANNLIQTASLDSLAKYAYFGTSSTLGVTAAAGQVFKIDLNSFSLVLESDLGALVFANCSIIDSKYQYAYFGNLYGKIMKIQLSTFTLVDTLTNIVSPDPTLSVNLFSATIDSNNKYAYFASQRFNRVYKIDLDTFTLNNTCIIYPYPSDVDIRSSAMSPDDKYLYLVTRTTPGTIIKISLETFTVVSTLVTPYNNLGAIAIRPQGDIAIVGSANNIILVIDLKTFSYVTNITPSFVAGVPLVLQVRIDSVGKYAYFSMFSTSYPIQKIDLDTLTIVDNLSIGQNNYNIIIDPNDEYLYALKGSSPYVIKKIKLSNFTLLTDDIPVSYLYTTGVFSDKFLYCASNSSTRLSQIPIYNKVLLSGLSGTQPGNLVNTTTDVEIDYTAQMFRPTSSNRLDKTYYLTLYVKGKTSEVIGKNSCTIRTQMKIYPSS